MAPAGSQLFSKFPDLPLTCPSLLLLPGRRSFHPPQQHRADSGVLSWGRTWSTGWFWDCNTPPYQCFLSMRAIRLEEES